MHFDAFWWHKIPGGIKFRCMLVTFLGWPQYVGSQVACLISRCSTINNHPVASMASKQPQTSFCMPEQTCTWSCIGCDKDETNHEKHHLHAMDQKPSRITYHIVDIVDVISQNRWQKKAMKIGYPKTAWFKIPFPTWTAHLTCLDKTHTVLLYYIDSKYPHLIAGYCLLALPSHYIILLAI